MRRLIFLPIAAMLLSALTATPSHALIPDRAEGQDARAAAIAAAARAATRHPVSQGFTKNWVWHTVGEAGSGLNKKCVFVEARATMKGSWWHSYGDDAPAVDKKYISWENLRLVDPSITARAWPETSTGGCLSTERVKLRGQLQEGYYSRSCEIDVDIAVGAGADSTGWSVGIEADPSYRCSNSKVGWSDFSWGNVVNQMGIFNNGTVLTFDKSSEHAVLLKTESVSVEGAWDVYAGFGEGPVAKKRFTAYPWVSCGCA